MRVNMKSKVWFVEVKNSEEVEQVKNKIKILLKESKAFDFIQPEDKVALKMHFGEEGNTGFIKPDYIRSICDSVRDKTIRAFLSDTNTLYRGRRLNSEDHLKLANEHGFSKNSMGIEVIIPDDTKKENTRSIPINQKNIKTAKLAALFIESDAIVAISHFKGHILTGFGGAIKNIGMGCATREGKLAQQCDLSPIVDVEKCTGCAECEKICPTEAIHLENNKSCIDISKCIGCASCIAVCPTTAMFIDFEAGHKVQEKMVEYAYAVLQNKKDQTVFLNFAVKINKECDCWSLENPRIAPDTGILASFDPVSIDKASFDLVNQICHKDIFKEAHPDYDGIKHLEYAQSLNLGNLDYELISL